MSFVRLLAVPWFLWLLLGQERLVAAGIVLLVIGGTDWVDGWLARRLGQVSKLGKMLDPVADRLAIIAAIVGGFIAGVLPGWFVIPLLAREGFMTLLTGWLMVSGRGTIDVRSVGKLATFLLYGAIPSFYLSAGGVWPQGFEPLAAVSAAIGLVLYYLAAAAYVGDALRKSAPADG